MPVYGAKNYIRSLPSGEVGLSLDNDLVTAFPAVGGAGVAPLNGEAFAVPSGGSGGGNLADGRTVRWQTLFAGTALGSVNMRIQGAMNDVPAEYIDLDTDTTVGGNSKTVVGVRARFLRGQVQAYTGGDATSKVTLKILP